MSSQDQPPPPQSTEKSVSERETLRRRAEDAYRGSTADLTGQLSAMSPEALRDALHELGVHQVELEMQNEELRRTQDELDTSQARYFDFYDMAPAGYCTVSGSGLIEQINLTAAGLLGVNRTALIGQEITRFILPDDQDIFYSMRARIAKVRTPQSCELRFVKHDGTPFWAHVHALAVPDHAGTPFLRVVMTDITERMLGTEELAAANKELAYQGEEKGKRAAELLSANEEIQRQIAELETAFMSTVHVVNTLSEMRDPYTAGHERKVAELAVDIGAELGLSARQQEGLHVAGFLHDIGKITVPAEILAKPGKLSWIEHRLVQEHAQAGYEVLKNVKFPWQIAEVVQQHHERIDGSGYPQGLKGEAILLKARILAVADVVEAMSSHRPYRPARGIEAALAEIERGRGTFFDTNVVDA